jgi:N utilization substance protein A
MKSEFTLAFNEIAEHSKLKREIILEALENAMITAYRKAVNASQAQLVEAKVDLGTGTIRVFAEKEVVEKVLEPHTEVALEDAHKVNPKAKLGDMVTVESTPKDFGRIAAQSAKQVILQKIREAEREAQYLEYVQRLGDILNGTVQAVSSQSVTLGLGRAEASLPRNQMVPGERYHAHQKLRAYVLEVRRTTKGPQIIVSRSHRNMLRRLLEYEVPEIYNGSVEIKSIAREPGHRSKVAVAAIQEGVDPVGACVGMRGVRIQSIVKELNDEKIDVIEWNPDQATFISKALSPARVTAVYLDDDPLSGKTAMVVVPDDQLSLAIGREGQNARLAAKLTSWRIDIKSLTEAAATAHKTLREGEQFAEVTQTNAEMLALAEIALAKKSEGKPLTPEEYQLLAKTIELVEKKVASGRQTERAAKVQKVAEIRATIPAFARKMSLAEAQLPEPLPRLLDDAEFKTVGEVMEQLAIDENRILQLEGFGAKELGELKTALATIEFTKPEPKPEPQPVPEAALVPEARAVEATPAEVAVATETPAQPEASVEPVAEAVAPTGEAVPVVEGEEALEDKDEEDDTSEGGKKKKKAKKKGATEIVFDEDLGVYVKRKARKAARAKDDFLGNPEDE